MKPYQNSGKRATCIHAQSTLQPSGRHMISGSRFSNRRSFHLGLLGVVFLATSLLANATDYPTTVAISARYTHAIANKSDGSLWAWGENGDGQLGNGTTSDSSVPLPVTQTNGPTNVIGLAAASEHSLALASDGRVWAWGYGLEGQLGNGQITNSSLPLLVNALTNISALAAGGYHSLSISNGNVWSWGWNYYGQLGDGTLNDNSNPVRVSGLSNVTAIAGGYDHSLAISNGNVWAWGYGYDGELGTGNNSARANPVPVTGLSQITAIAAGDWHSLAISNGIVWAWGLNN